MRELDADDRDALMERLDVGVPGPAGVPPVTDPGDRWWEELKFDPAGVDLDYQGEKWRPEQLASADPGLARYAAALLKDRPEPANINNRACALVYADQKDLAEPLRLLESIKAKSAIADDNHVLLERRGRAALAGAG